MRMIEKILWGIILLVLLGGCEKKNTPDEDFQLLVKAVEKDFRVIFYEKNENEVFLPIELLEKNIETDSSSNAFTKIEKLLSFSKKGLSEKNKSIQSGIYFFSLAQLPFIKKGTITDSIFTFSMIQVLDLELNKKGISPEEQFSQIVDRLEEIPLYFSKAKQLIIHPSKAKLERAIQQFSQDYFYLREELSLLIRKPDILKEDQIDFSQKNEKAQIAIKDFIAFLNSHLFELENNPYPKN